MRVSEDRWLSEIFEYSVFKIESDPAVDTTQASQLVSNHASEQPVAMYYAKIATDQIELVRQLGKAGLYVVDVNMTFGLVDNKGPAHVSSPRYPLWSISEINADQHEAVLAIAGSCFRYSRFHLDPLVPRKIANRIKHDWILNYVRGQRGEKLFVASANGKLAGFLAVIATESGEKSGRTIDLVGVDKTFQGQGAGQALGEFFIDYYRDRCDFLTVGTQGANVPSIRLYQKLGFSLIKSEYVMHMHVRNGQVQA